MSFKKLIFKVNRETKDKDFLTKSISFYISKYLNNSKRHRQARYLAHNLIKNNQILGHFYLAQFYFLYGRFEKAYLNINLYLEKEFNIDAIYLKSSILKELNKRDKAFELLKDSLSKSKRLKTWLLMANLVDNEDKFKTLYGLYNEAIKKDPSLVKKRAVKKYIITAAARAKEYDIAIELQTQESKRYAKLYVEKQQNKFLFKLDSFKSNAAQALEDISEIFKKADIEMFLVSGTFLGCIRENKILGHDQDVDVGIWDNYSQEYISSLIQKSGRFYLHEPLSEKIVKARHLNGVLVDVFFHYKENGLIYHEGVKCRWANKPFELVEYKFLGKKYLGAKNYDLYLKENYGEWKTPKKEFDYVLDTPNMKITNQKEMILHLLKLLTKEYSINNYERIFEYIKNIDNKYELKEFQKLFYKIKLANKIIHNKKRGNSMSKIVFNINYLGGLNLYKKKKFDEAKVKFRRALYYNIGHPECTFKLGMCYFKKQEWKKARQYIEKALILNPSKTGWKKQLEQSKKHLGIPNQKIYKEENLSLEQKILANPNDAKLYRELATNLQKQGLWWQEIEALKKAIALDDTKADWYYRLGQSLEIMNRYSEASQNYIKAIELKKDKADAEWYYRQGYCYERKGHDGAANPKAADQAYRQAVAKDKNLNAKRFGIGVFHQQRGHWPQAAQAYADQLKKSLIDAELHYRLGIAYDRCYEWARAEECYKKALTLDKKQPNWHYRLGFVLERQGKYEQAALAYQFAAINRDKHTPYWFYRWGYVLEQQGDFQAAAEAFLQTRQQPSLDKPLKELAEVQGDFDKTNADEIAEIGSIRQEEKEKNAIEMYAEQFASQQFLIQHLEQILEEDTTNPEVWYKLGNCYEREENWQAAAEAYQHALARQNDHIPEWFYRLGYVLTQAGKYTGACEAFRNTRILQKAYGITEKPLNENQNSRLILSYSEYYNCLEVQKNTILFESFNGSSITCNPYAISEYMLKSKVYDGWSFIWVLNDIQRVPEHLKANKNIYYISKGSDAYLRAICQAEYLVNNSGFPPYFIRKENQKYLATWHGTPLKTLGKEQKYKFFDHKRTQRNFLQASHIISPNAHTSKIQMKSYDINNIYIGRYAETGYPRIDLTINASHEERSKMLSTMGLDTATPIILYAPTWRGTLQDVEFDVEKLKGDIESILGTGCQVIFRGHSLLEGILEKINIGCTVVPESIDTNSLLSIVDILITDYSSIFFDFIPLNRPIIYYTYDIEDYEKERGLYFDIKDMPGEQCQNIEMVVETVKAILFSQNFELRGYSEAIKKYNAHDDGKASERVVQFFINACDKYDIEKFGSNKKNILFYPGGIEPNGITTSFLNLINNIDKNSVNPVIAFNPNPIESDVEKKAQFDRLDYNLDFIPRYGNVVMTLEERYLRLRAEKNYYNNVSDEELDVLRNMYAREFRRIFGLSKFDAVIHFSGYDHFWASILASANVPKKSIYLHNDLYAEFVQKSPYLNIVFKHYNYFDGLVSVSNLTSNLNKRTLSDEYKLNEHAFQYCNNLQNPHEVLQRAEEGIDDDQKLFDHASHVFITLGRLSVEKDHEKLIKAFSIVVEQQPKAKLLILGDGPLKQHLTKLIEDLNLKNTVYLLGRRFNPFPLLKRADCFVLSSNHEGQPMVLFEAMILKKPIISTDIVGSRSAIEGRTGHLVENSEAGLAQGMLDFLDGKLNFPEYDITDYQKQALEMFYTKVCGLEKTDA